MANDTVKHVFYGFGKVLEEFEQQGILLVEFEFSSRDLHSGKGKGRKHHCLYVVVDDVKYNLNANNGRPDTFWLGDNDVL